MNIVRTIERLREELNKLGLEKGFKDPQVIKLSQRLDVLINMYYKQNIDLGMKAQGNKRRVCYARNSKQNTSAIPNL
ncbi:MAG: aspartyl-phosphate phosphatase Spo0E family protein [Syntrophomonas sp.]